MSRAARGVINPHLSYGERTAACSPALLRLLTDLRPQLDSGFPCPCITGPVRPPLHRPVEGRQLLQPYTQMSDVFPSGGRGMLLVSLERKPATSVLLLGATRIIHV